VVGTHTKMWASQRCLSTPSEESNRLLFYSAGQYSGFEPRGDSQGSMLAHRVKDPFIGGHFQVDKFLYVFCAIVQYRDKEF
jgi:hypothetical protein